ncbi:MAG: ATP-dependent deoxyribonuclease subunit A, partial [Acidobacteria bacterium]
MAAFIHWLVEESGWKVSSLADSGKSIPITPSHVCVLFRRFISWGDDVTHAYTRALEARGIPHLLVGARSFHQREEVETIRAVLNAVEWPDDELSVFATLRGSLFWIPDALLLRFREKVGKLHPFRPLPDTLPEELKVVGSTLQVLADLHRRRNQRPMVETIHEILELTRAHAGFALRPAGHQVLANLQRICDMARSFEIGGGISFRGFVEQLEREAEGPTSNEAAVLEEGVEGVRLMTVHKAKGLEFPVVVLADITCKLSSGKADRYVDAEQGLAATTILGCAPWELRDHEDVEIRRDEAEGVRITYVAATRARDLLIIPAIGDGARDGWLRPLNKVIYPPRKQWRESEVAVACPRFGEATVLERPNPGEPESSVKPGLHKPEAGEHRVVWWDPAVLKLNVETHFGLRQEEIL